MEHFPKNSKISYPDDVLQGLGVLEDVLRVLVDVADVDVGVGEVEVEVEDASSLRVRVDARFVSSQTWLDFLNKRKEKNNRLINWQWRILINQC